MDSSNLYDDSVVANIKQEAPDVDESPGQSYYYGDSQNGEQSNDDPFEQSFPLHPGLLGEDAQAGQGTDEELVGNGITDGAMFMTLTQELNEQGELWDNNDMEENMEVDNVQYDVNGEPYDLPEDGTFRCKYCCIRFVSFTALTEHINRLHQSKYKCRYCNKGFVQCQELAGHVRQAHLTGNNSEKAKTDKNVGTTGNTEADDTNDNSPDFIPYKTTDFGASFRCMYCYAKLGSEELVMEHIVRLHKSKYQCKYCSQTFNRSQELAGHVRKAHLEEKQVFDVYKKHRPVSSFSQPARKSFDHVSNKPFKKVKAKVTLMSSGYSKYKCGYCAMVFFKQQAMACHVRNAHKTKRTPDGHIEYTSKGNKKKRLKMGKHRTKFDSVKTEIKTEPQSDGDVESKATTENKIQNIGYTEIKSEYTCKYCMLIFPRSQDLACHTRISHPVTCSHWCKYCPSTFTSKDKLINHVLRHLRQEFRITRKGHSCCHLCKLRYTNINALRSHMKIHFKGNVLEDLSECKYCGQPFLIRKSCDEHEKKHQMKNQESKTEIKMEVKQEKEDAEVSKSIPVKTERKDSLGDIPIKDGGKLTLDDIPFQCGMCTSRFPNSQYLLHHITLHMEGKYVFKVETGNGGKEPQQATAMKSSSNLNAVMNTKQIIIPKITKLDINSSKHRIIYVNANKTGITSIGAPAGNTGEGNTEKKQADSVDLSSVQSILKFNLEKKTTEGKDDDNKTTTKIENQIEMKSKSQFSTEGLPNFDKIDERKFENKQNNKMQVAKQRSVATETDASDNDYVSNCLIEENKDSGDYKEYPLMTEMSVHKPNKKARYKQKGFKKGIDFANGQWQECEYCMFLCKNQTEFEIHMEGHKKSTASFIDCKLCTRKFVSKWHLNKHMESHKSNEYQCTVCQMSFSTSFQVLEHMSVHANDNPS